MLVHCEKEYGTLETVSGREIKDVSVSNVGDSFARKHDCCRMYVV